jgi:PPM family protein phosphatase
MSAPRVEKILGKVPVTERRNIPAPIQIYGESRASEKHPERNEDAMFISEDYRAFGIFDGMGGEAGGQVASNLAKEYISNALNTFPDGLSLKQEEKLMHDILLDANKRMLQEKRGRSEGMNTTASVVRIWQGPGSERKAIVGNVGDSRVYIFRNGTLKQITLDDNLLRADYPNEKKARAVQEKMNNTVDPVKGLNAEEQDLWKKRNVIAQYLGKENISPRINVVDLLPGDQILVCSDGISDNLTDTEIAVILDQSHGLRGATERLINYSLARSRESKQINPRAKQDDMTAIVVGIPSLSVRRKQQEENISRELRKDNVGWEKGMLAPVQRSGGDVEYWTIDFIEPDGKRAIVSKPEPKGKKRIREIFLPEIPKETPDISGAESEAQLYYIMERLGGIQGSQGHYSSKDIILLLKDFFDGRGVSAEAITETSGLRKKAIELKKMREARKIIRHI